MAQGPNAMQEPSMDELLASIREIIEENTGSSPNKTQEKKGSRREENSPAVSRNPAVAKQVRLNQGEPQSFSVDERGMREKERGVHNSVDQSNKMKDDNLSAPPVHDAMNALAARIGLRHNENADHDDNVHDDGQNVVMQPSGMLVKKMPLSNRAQQSALDSVSIAQARLSNTIGQNGSNEGAVPHHSNADNVVKKSANGASQPRNPAEQAYQTRNHNEQAYQARTPNEQAYQARTPNEQAYQARTPNEQAYQARTPNEQAYQARTPNEQAYQARTPNEQAFQSRNSNEQAFQARNSNEQAFQARNSNEQAFQARKPTEQAFQARKPTEQAFQSRNSNEQAFQARKPTEQAFQSRNSNEQAFQSRKPTEQAFQSRNSMVQASSSHQPMSSQSSVAQNHVETAKYKEAIQPRESQQSNENNVQRDGYGESSVSTKPMYSGGGNSSNTSRHAPSQPRTSNSVMRPNNFIPKNNIGQNSVKDLDESVELPTFKEDHDKDVRRDLRVNQVQSGQFQRPNDNQLLEEMQSLQSAKVSENRRLVSGITVDVKHGETEYEQEIDVHDQANNLRNYENQMESESYPHSDTQRPHFLTQALRSAFMSVPADESDFQTASSLPQSPLRPQSVSTVSTQLTRVELKAAEMIEAEVKREMDNLDKGLEAGFEKSAENLLRPYIAEWLDEHFGALFEKILREEIKRVMDSQLLR